MPQFDSLAQHNSEEALAIFLASVRLAGISVKHKMCTPH